MPDDMPAVQRRNYLTRGEREDLLKLIRQRAKIAKQSAAQRSAELRADFEKQISSIYSFDQRKVWQDAQRAVQQAVAEAEARISEECQRLGIPERFRPGVSAGWYRRGENASAERRAELRRVAYTEIAALEKRAVVEIERQSLIAQTELVAVGLSGAASAFLEQLPSVESLMPALDALRVQAELPERPDYY